MAMKSLLYVILLTVIGGIAMQGCGRNATARFENGEEAAADVEAAMMAGREAARIFINRDWKDTAELQRNLLEARARRCVYDTSGRREAAAAFDSGFVSTIRTVNPDIARQLK